MKAYNINQIFKLYFREDELKKIQDSTIMIVGCGGLGSNIANILIRTGFMKLILIDYDVVELKNLNRQQYYPCDVGKPKVEVLKKNLLKINPKAKINAIKDMINEKKLKDIIKRFKPDIIVEAVDKEWTKMMIFETSVKLNKNLVTASGLAGYGDVEKIKIVRQKKYTIIGDLVSRCGCCDECYKENNCNSSREKQLKAGLCKMPLAPKVTTVAAMQADEVLRRVLGGNYDKKTKT